MSKKLSLKLLIALVFVFAGLAVAMAFGTNNPQVFGHSAGELDFSGITSNVVTTGNVQGGKLTGQTVCIGTDCRTAWPSSTSTGTTDPSTGGPTLIFQAQRFIDDDTNYYADLNTGGKLGGSWEFGNDIKIGVAGKQVTSDGRLHIQSGEDLYLNPYSGETYVGYGGGAGNLHVLGKLDTTQVCINGDCKTSWPASTSSTPESTTIITNDYAAGMWCGRGHTIGIENIDYEMSTGPDINCQSQNPSVSCPSGFTRTNFAINTRYDNPTEYYWTCIKN